MLSSSGSQMAQKKSLCIMYKYIYMQLSVHRELRNYIHSKYDIYTCAHTENKADKSKWLANVLRKVILTILTTFH